MTDIILSTFNGEKYIAEQLESILDSDVSDFRVLVFDDVSSDNTCLIVQDFCEKAPDKVFLIENICNKGFCRNFLDGLQYAVLNMPADYYAFCDQDDVWLENRLSICIESMRSVQEKNSSDIPVLLFTDSVLVDSNLNSLGKTFFGADRLNANKLTLERVLMENRCTGCTSFMNAALAEKVTCFDRRIRYHDWWVALIAAAFGQIVYIDVPTVLYRQHDANIVGQTSFLGYLKNRADEKDLLKKRLRMTFAQASAFYKIYGRKLSRVNKRTVREFIAMGTTDPIERRRLLIKNGFYKSGLIRNVGLLFYL